MAVVVWDKSRESYVCACSFSERDIPRLNGFQWDASTKCWHQPNPHRALKLYHLATEETKKRLDEARGFHYMDRVLITTPKAVHLRPKQKEAVNFCLHRRNSYYAAKPGMGKTAVAITVWNSLKSNGFKTGPCLYLLPPFMVANVLREFKTFAVRSPTIEVASGEKYRFKFSSDITIVPSSLLANQDIHGQLLDVVWYLLLIDEAQEYKSDNSQRAKALYGGTYKKTIKGVKKILKYESLLNKSLKSVHLSGTPLLNRPIELWNPLHHAAPWAIKGMTYYEFVNRYCAAKEVVIGRNWDGSPKTALDTSGSSNESELKELLKDFMLHHFKDDMEPKIYADFWLTIDKATEKKIKVHEKIWNGLTPAERRLREQNPELFGEIPSIATMRKELGLMKAKLSTDKIESAMQESGKVLVLTWHTDAQQWLVDWANKKKFRHVTLNGKVQSKERDELIKEFNEDAECKIMFAQIKTAVGFNADKSCHRVVRVERSYVPGDNEQAEDRVHRLTQTEQVLVDDIRLDHPLDNYIRQTNETKIETIKKISGEI
jgi:SWI/SNF-related matrix-associated actin-dependent regulator 1 of chromatin subfamily A